MAWDDYAPRAIASLSRDLSITPQQAAGIVGQLGFESEGLQAINERRPVVPGSRGGFGWAQWTGPRRKAFESWAENHGADINDPDTNYGFLVHELTQTPESAALDAIRSTKDAQEAGRVFTDKFLRPGVPNHEGRQSWTEKALNFLVPAAQAQTSASLANRISAARDAGFSDEEIRDRLISNPDTQARIQRAKDAGFSEEEIMERIGLKAPAQAAQSSALPENSEPSALGQLGQQVGRQLGLTARYGIEGVGGAIGMLSDPIAAAINPALEAFGLPRSATASSTASSLADALSLPAPQGSQERIVGDAARLMASAGTIAGGAQALSRGAAGVTQGVLEQLGSQPVAQVAGAAGAGLSGGAAREAGAGAGVQTAAALAGGLLAGSAASRLTAPPRQKGMTPETGDLKKRASALYDQAEQRGIAAQQQHTKILYRDAIDLATKEGLVAPSGKLVKGLPKVRDALDMIGEFAGKEMTAKQMQSVRKTLATAAGSTDRAEARIGAMLTRMFDDFTAPFAPELADARSLYAAHMRSRQLETLRDVAESRSKQYSQSGLENALRSEYRNLYNRILRGRERGWSAEQVEAIRRVAEGTVPANAARQVGKLAPTGVVSAGLGGGVPFMIGNALGGPPVGAAASIGTMGIGALSRNAATALTSRNAAIAEALARGMPLTASSSPSFAAPLGALYGTALLNQ